MADTDTGPADHDTPKPTGGAAALPADTPPRMLFRAPRDAAHTPKYVDATATFGAAAAALPVGGLVMGSLTMFEAMAALELMDPKMDCPDRADPPDVEALLAAGDIDFAPPIAQLGPFLDRLVVHEVGWSQGYAFAETLLTCFYFHPPVTAALKAKAAEAAAPATTKALYAAVLSLIKTCEVQRQIIIRADIYEEEDFSPQSLGRSAAADVDSAGLVGMVNEACDALAAECGAANALRSV